MFKKKLRGTRGRGKEPAQISQRLQCSLVMMASCPETHSAMKPSMLKAGWLGTSLRMPSRLTCRRKPVSVSPTVDVRVDCLADLTEELTDELLTAAALLRRRLKLLSFQCLAAIFRGDACSLGRMSPGNFCSGPGRPAAIPAAAPQIGRLDSNVPPRLF